MHRNRLRRLYREAFRLCAASYAEGLDLILIPRKNRRTAVAKLLQLVAAAGLSTIPQTARESKSP